MANWNSKLPQVMNRARADLVKFLNEEAELLKERAQALAPVKTGHLRASIHVERQDDLIAEVAVGAEYVVVVEFGGVHTPPNPFLGRATAEREEGFEGRLSKAVPLGK